MKSRRPTNDATRRRGSSGQALVEYTLLFAMACIVVIGLIDMIGKNFRKNYFNAWSGVISQSAEEKVQKKSEDTEK